MLTDGVVEWDPNGIQMTGKRPYGDNTSNMTQLVQSARRICQEKKLAPVEYESDLVLGSL